MGTATTLPKRWHPRKVGNPPRTVVRQVTIQVPTTLRASGPFRQAARSSAWAATPFSGPLRSTTAAVLATAAWAATTRSCSGTYAAATSRAADILSAVSAIKKTLSKTGGPTVGDQPVLTVWK